MTDPFHEAAIAHETPGSMVDERVIAFIKSRRHELFSDRHAHCISQALPQRASGCLYTGRIAVFGVARRFAM